MDDARNSWRVVGSVVLKLAGAQGLLKGLLLVHKVVDSVGLVAVCDDSFISHNTDRSIDYQVRIGHFGRVKRLCADTISLLHKRAVAAVLASAHDKVSNNRLFAAGRFPDKDSPAVVFHAVQFLFDRFCNHN